MECGASRVRDCDPIRVPLKGTGDSNAVDQSTVHLLSQGIIQTCLSLTAVGALERVEYAILGGSKENI